jgi:hypothetical protein
MSKYFILIAFVVALGCARQTNDTQTTFRVGASSASINPSPGSFIAGDKQNRKFTGVHDSLYVKAVVLHDGEHSLALITIDCIGLMYPELLRIRERVAMISDFPADRIVMSSTHTHSGPDVVGLWGIDYEHTGVDTAYQTFLVNTAAAQIKIAHNNKQEATLHAGETIFGEPWVQNICNEEIDRAVTILQFKDLNGNSLASFTNFACHPTFLDAVFTEVSADYVGSFYKQLDAQWKGVNLFLQGPIGGWVQPVDGKGTWEAADKRGKELGAAVIETMKQSSELHDYAIRYKSKQVSFPVDNEAWKQLSAIGTVPRKITDSVTTEIAWFTIGPAQFATHPGETAPYYGLETKKLMKPGPKFVLGLSNDALGYILKPVFYEDSTRLHSEYLTRTSVGKQTAPLLMKALEEIIPVEK